MAEEGRKISGFSPGLGVLLFSDKQKLDPQKSHLISHRDDIGNQSLERTIEHIFDLPNKSICCPSGSVDIEIIGAILKDQLPRFQDGIHYCNREGISITESGYGLGVVAIDNSSIFGEFRIIREPFLIESLAVFSSARANACLWKGKWMYEVTLETCGVQQIGWSTVSCPFTDRKGVGDVEDSYAFDGKRVNKWNKEAKTYGQPWVVGDVIGCCIDLDNDTISFFRNGVSLGVAFDGIRKMVRGLGYYPSISLSEGERCDLNFGSRPFKYPVDGFLALQPPPRSRSVAGYLLQCLSRLMEIRGFDKSDALYFEKLRRLKRFALLDELFYPIANGICECLFSVLEKDGSCEYISWDLIVPFLLELFGTHPPHEYASLDKVVELFLEVPGCNMLFRHMMLALSYHCKVAPLILTDCPYTGSYPFLAVTCHILRRQDVMFMLWNSQDFEFSMEGFLSRRSPNKHDLQCMIPFIWWPGSCEDMGSESSMMLTTSALSGAISKIEEMHRELCRLIIHFVPPSDHQQLPGSVFRSFLQNFILRVRGADQKATLTGTSSNSALLSLYTVILHFLSEGFGVENIFELSGSKADNGDEGGFLHKCGKRNFPIGLITNDDPHRAGIPRLGGSFQQLIKSHPVAVEEAEEVMWDEAVMDDEDARITHSTQQKPCCCSSTDAEMARIARYHIKHSAKMSRGICGPAERPSHVSSECSSGSLNEEIVDKPSSSERADADFLIRSVQPLGSVPMASQLSSDLLREQELLDIMLLLYHMSVAPNFRQAFYYMSHQSQSISLLDDTDKQIREKSCIEQVKRLREARIVYREELVDCVRQCTWYRIFLFSRWKQRGMYATCMWIVQLLLVLGDADSLFLYIPEFYVESLVDCFHALRKSDPPFVSPAIFIKQGLSSFVTFVVKHFSDSRILSADIRDLLLQSISVLVQYKDYLIAFESNKEAVERMPKALLAAFDNRSWIPVTNILLRLCKGFGFGSKHTESSSSLLFQLLLREACVQDEELFSSFLNRLFNTLSWTMTEFSVSVREMHGNYQGGDLAQRKCSVVFDLSCSLARVLEFWTHEIPQVFLSGPDMNLRRLTELVIFILNHVISVADAEYFDLYSRRPVQYQEKTNRTMILAPLVGIVLNLMDATADPGLGDLNDVVEVFASMDCPATVYSGFQYLLGYNWGNVLKDDAALAKLVQLEEFSSYLSNRTLALESEGDCNNYRTDDEVADSCCCICYTRDSDTMFEPCHHKSCFGCITRHLLNSQRCFFCNATIVKVVVVEDSGRILDKKCCFS